MDRRPPFDAADSRDVALYDELPLWSALAGQLLLEHVTLASRRSVLDLGCGTGFPLLELAERLGRGAHVVGLDAWAGALARARSKIDRWCVPNASIARGNGAAMPFEAHRATVPSLGARLEAAGFRVTLVRECQAVMRFANAEALLEHHFIRMGFRPAWEEIAGEESLAARAGVSREEVRLAYLEAVPA